MFACVRSTAAWRRLPVTPLARSICTSRTVAAKDGKEQPPAADAASEPADPEVAEEVVIQDEVLGSDPIKAVMPTEPEEAEGKTRGRRGDGETRSGKWMGFEGWLIVEGKKYKKMVPSKTNYVGNGRIPFPLNPYFRPRAPVSDATKEAVYQDYLSNPLNRTPRRLAEKFSISIKRVEAIIKLKAIEHHMVAHKQIVVQKNLTAGMESMLGVNSSAKIIEKVVAERASAGAPRFHAIPEEQSFDATDAAEVLGRKPYQQILDRLAASKPYTVDYEGLDEKFAPRPQKALSKSEQARLDSLGSETDRVLEKDDTLTSRRWKFVFTDISQDKDMKDRFVLIREKDGTLKEANRDYKLKRYGKLWFH
ncbi:hypothetical protein LPJ63_000736 [Coemansia sp. RSA 2711]|nr:hypothetical protein LPJ63_000736 [Coemansia sp. RSA 2711]